MTVLADSRTPLASYLAAVLRAVRPLPPLDLDLTQAYGNVLAEDLHAPGPLPAFDHAAVDGYAARLDDLLDATRSPTTRSRAGRPACASLMSSKRAAYPSIAAWSNAGTGLGEITSSARTLPCAEVISRSSGGSGRSVRSTPAR